MTTYKVDWFRVPLSPAELDALNQPSDLRGLLQAGGHLLVMVSTAALVILAWRHAAWWWLIPALYLHGTVCGFMINAVHEFVHGTVFRKRWPNQLMVHLFAFIGWINHYAYWASHSEHHKFTLHEPYDREVILPVRFTLGSFIAAFTLDPKKLYQVIRESFQLARGKIEDDWLRELLEGQQRRFPVFRWARCMLFGHLAIALVSLWYGWWIVPVIVSMTPMYGRGLFSLLNNAQHVGLAGHATDFRLNSRSIDVNPVFRFLYWHMNYHIEHHMYAGVPCYKLRYLNHKIAADLPKPPRGLVATWYHIIAVLYRQAEDPGYVFHPALPGQKGADPEKGSDPISNCDLMTTGTDGKLDPTPFQTPFQSRRWQCRVCGFTYVEALGLPEEGIAPGTSWDAIPADWRCPDCGMSKSKFRMVEITA